MSLQVCVLISEDVDLYEWILFQCEWLSLTDSHWDFEVVSLTVCSIFSSCCEKRSPHWVRHEPFHSKTSQYSCFASLFSTQFLFIRLLPNYLFKLLGKKKNVTFFSFLIGAMWTWSHACHALATSRTHLWICDVLDSLWVHKEGKL